MKIGDKWHLLQLCRKTDARQPVLSLQIISKLKGIVGGLRQQEYTQPSQPSANTLTAHTRGKGREEL